MADKQISALAAATSIGTSDLFVIEQAQTAKKATGQVVIRDLAAALDGHGGIASITKTGTVGLTDTYAVAFADGTTSTLEIKNGRSITGAVVSDNDYTLTLNFNDGTTYKSGSLKGAQTYVHIRYADREPSSTFDPISTTPKAWMGICTTTAAFAPAVASQYKWYKIKGEDAQLNIRYSVGFERPTDNSMMRATPTVDSAWIGFNHSADASMLTEWDNYSWARFKGDTGDGASVVSQTVSFAYSNAPTTTPSTWYGSVASAASAYGSTQGAYLWTRLNLEWNNGEYSEIVLPAYQGIDGDGLQGVVKSVNSSITPDADGNITLGAAALGAIPAPAQASTDNVLKYDGSAWVAGSVAGGTVKSVNAKNPDANGAVTLYGSDIRMVSSGTQTVKAAIEANAAAFENKQDKFVAVQVTIPASGWSGGSNTVSVAQITANNNVRVSPYMTVANYTAWNDAGVYPVEPQTAGQLTFICESTPSGDLIAALEIWG